MNAAAEERARRTGGKWRHQHAQFQDACKAGRGDETVDTRQASPARRAPDGMVPCPHCGRRFDSAVAERHIPICANVKNKPKAPPSPGRAPSPSPARDASPARGGSRSNRDSPANSPRPSARQQQLAPPGSSARGSSSHGRLPSLPPGGGAAKRERPGGSPPGGAGAQAARSLRSSGSSSRLPAVESMNSSQSSFNDPALTIRDGTSGQEADRTLLKPSGSPADTTDGSNPGSGRRHPQKSGSNSAPGSNSQTRLGLRRTAMMFRLLSHVPRPALERELLDAGVEVTDDMDEDMMIEAIMEKLG